MCFATPFMINSPNGIIYGQKGDFIINRPYNLHWHTNIQNSDKGFVNSWCHVDFPEIEEILTKYELRSDVLYHTVDYMSFVNDLKEINYEYQNRTYYSDELLVLLFEKMILGLARQNKIYSVKNEIKNNYVQELYSIRKNILLNYKENYTIEILAKQINISSEYFLILYKKLFNISPIKDLCLKRISVAKVLLLSTDYSINTVANLCGYNDANYFSRLFKKVTGVTPYNYKK